MTEYRRHDEAGLGGRRYRVTLSTDVDVTINDPDVIPRLLGRSYKGTSIDSLDQALAIIAEAIGLEGRYDLSEVDGWEDLPEDAVTVTVIDEYDDVCDVTEQGDAWSGVDSSVHEHEDDRAG